ncbi:MAG: dihydrodipicolinate synthase family protein [Anaerolineaceae bacterium]|nr:dihydrodipicolinate synthase family protein [Anaerolineaceae bacterium]
MTTKTELSTLSGVIPPMLTPLTAAGQVDAAGIKRLVNFLIDGGVSGFFVLGSSGEGPSLTLADRSKVIAETARAAAGRVPVLAGVLEPSTVRTIEAARLAEEAGADCLVATSPYYFSTGLEHQVVHFMAIAESTALPVLLYNIPPSTHNPIGLETVRRLLPVEKVIGIKDSAGDWEHFEALLALKKTRPSFRVFQGAQPKAAAAVLAGADGLVPGLSNLVPGLFTQLVRAGQAGDRAQALALQARIDELSTLHTHGFWLVCLKYAASLLGLDTGAVYGWPAPDAQAAGPSPLAEPGRAAIREIIRPYLPA